MSGLTREELVDILCGKWHNGPEGIADEILELATTPTRGAVAVLQALDGADPERAHALADNEVLRLVPAEVRDAYQALADRCGFWASA